MKHKFYSLLLLLFLLCASSSLVVKADTTEPETTTVSEIESTTAQETTTAAPANQTITANKTVKVNKTFKIKKTLKLNKTTINNYNFTTSNSKVTSVSATGVVKGLKKGSAVITLTSKTDGSTFAQINVKVKNRYTKKQLRLMSSIIYSEAGGECYAGKKAVGIVIMNRIKSTQFPNTLKGVIYQRGQFTPARNGSLNKALAQYDSGKLNKKCIKAAKATLNGDTYVSYRKQTINMDGYLFFSGYIKQSRLRIQGHHFK